MSKFIKTAFAFLGMCIAVVFAATEQSSASGNADNHVNGGSCVGDGACGVTSGGTLVIGKWTEEQQD